MKVKVERLSKNKDLVTVCFRRNEADDWQKFEGFTIEEVGRMGEFMADFAGNVKLVDELIAGGGDAKK